MEVSPAPVELTVSRNGAAPSARAAPRMAPLAAQLAEPVGQQTSATFEPVALPPDRRLSASRLAALAAASGIAAIVLGALAFSSGIRSHSGGASADAPPPAHQQAISLLARRDVERLPLRGSVGRIILVVERAGDATLVLNGLTAADSKWAYQAWIFPPGAYPAEGFSPGPQSTGTVGPRPAALFSGREALVPLTASVPPGATVAVTLEPAEGSFAPTRTPRLLVERKAGNR